jgi:ABC-2 type transport system ATP-binding protein
MALETAPRAPSSPVPIEAAPPPQPSPAAPSSPPVLRCVDLRKRFGERVAVDGIGFTIGPGETYGLLGPNGAGKTTTISMVCGILGRDGGEVLIEDRPFDPGATELKGEIGYVPQDLAIYPDLSARENLAFFGRLYGLTGRPLADRVAEVLEIVDLADRANERTSQYSGGMKRRLNIAVGLLHRPRLLVLDEPTVGVDPQSRNAILESIEALKRRKTDRMPIGQAYPVAQQLVEFLRGLPQVTAAEAAGSLRRGREIFGGQGGGVFGPIDLKHLELT